MAVAGNLQTMADDGARDASARLRHSVAGRPAGPFDVASSSTKTTTARDTLVTALLVIYPAFATVAAIVVGLALTRGV